jgi:hypothetical protein
MSLPRNASTNDHLNTSEAHSKGVKLSVIWTIGQRSCCSTSCSVNISASVRKIGLVIELRDMPALWKVLTAKERLAAFIAMAQNQKNSTVRTLHFERRLALQYASKRPLSCGSPLLGASAGCVSPTDPTLPFCPSQRGHAARRVTRCGSETSSSGGSSTWISWTGSVATAVGP